MLLMFSMVPPLVLEETEFVIHSTTVLVAVDIAVVVSNSDGNSSNSNGTAGSARKEVVLALTSLLLLYRPWEKRESVDVLCEFLILRQEALA
mmetsp:Transcript_13453/g.15438  ORF Transcript_13453/g.15438 Transcript_13453/m.15438 type:complete len:92 (+) Transcript_13453:1036-1311(+)